MIDLVDFRTRHKQLLETLRARQHVTLMHEKLDDDGHAIVLFDCRCEQNGCPGYTLAVSQAGQGTTFFPLDDPGTCLALADVLARMGGRR